MNLLQYTSSLSNNYIFYPFFFYSIVWQNKNFIRSWMIIISFVEICTKVKMYAYIMTSFSFFLLSLALGNISWAKYSLNINKVEQTHDVLVKILETLILFELINFKYMPSLLHVQYQDCKCKVAYNLLLYLDLVRKCPFDLMRELSIYAKAIRTMFLQYKRCKCMCKIKLLNNLPKLLALFIFSIK